MKRRAEQMALGLVVYMPGPPLLDRLGMALGEGYQVYIYDNSPKVHLVRDYIKGYVNAVYLTAGRNMGLGVGLSTICAQASYDGHEAILFLDQDTGLTPETLSSVSEFFQSRSGDLGEYCAVNFDPALTGTPAPEPETFRDVTLIINSGTLFLLRALEKMNWLDTSYFVDGVDYKFCLDALCCNLKIGMFSGIPGFDHESEQGNERYWIFNRIYPARRYKLSRILDVVRAYSRIVFCSARFGKFRYGAKIVRFLVIYLLIQAYVRLAKPQERQTPEAKEHDIQT